MDLLEQGRNLSKASGTFYKELSKRAVPGPSFCNSPKNQALPMSKPLLGTRLKSIYFSFLSLWAKLGQFWFQPAGNYGGSPYPPASSHLGPLLCCLETRRIIDSIGSSKLSFHEHLLYAKHNPGLFPRVLSA